MNTVKYPNRMVSGWRTALYMKRSRALIFCHMPVVTMTYEPTCEPMIFAVFAWW